MKGENFSSNQRDKPINKGKEDVNFKKQGDTVGALRKQGAAASSDKPKAQKPKTAAIEPKDSNIESTTPAPKQKESTNKLQFGDGKTETATPKSKAVQFKQKQRFQFHEKGGAAADTVQLSERQQKKLDKLDSRANKAENKYFRQDKKQPKRNKLKLTDKPSDGKRRVKLHFEEQTKAPKEQIEALQAPKQAVKTGLSSVLHSTATAAVDGSGEKSTDEKQIRQVMDKGVNLAKDTATAPVRFHSWSTERKYHKADIAQDKAVKARTKSEYKKFRLESKARQRENPHKYAKPSSNPISNALQKKRFMAQYRKSLDKNSRKVGQSLSKALVKLVNLVTGKLKRMGLVILAIVLLVVGVGSCMQGMSIAGTGIFKGIFSTTYPADDKELSDADWYFSDLEAGLVDSIQNAERNHPNYDEYRFFLNGALSSKESLINAIGHNPFAFLSFISVMHEDFKFAEIQGDLLEFFNVVYQINFETQTETRYRTVTDSDGNTHRESYTYYILNTRLTVSDWDTVIKPYIDSKDGERQYNEYINSGGNHQMFGTPFNFYWYPYISCHYGGRDNPTGANTGATTASGQEMHTGLDIAVAGGTPIYSIMEGKVTYAGWHDLYGNYVDIEDKNGNKSRYAHCSRLLVSAGQEVQKGQAIAEVGRTGNSTGNHLHLEIFLGGTRVNPVFLVQYQPKNDEESED